MANWTSDCARWREIVRVLECNRTKLLKLPRIKKEKLEREKADIVKAAENRRKIGHEYTGTQDCSILARTIT